MMEDDSNAWIFPKEVIEATQPTKKIKQYRSKTIWFMQDVGKALSFDNITKSTAAVFFHRFYLFHSFEQHDRFMVGLACLFLASKVEEKAVKVKDLADVYFKLQPVGNPNEGEYQVCVKDIILKERILLNTLNFDYVVTHPYEFCQRKVIAVKSYIQHDLKEFLASMYCIINDTYRTTLCLQYAPQQIAMAAFYIASIQLSIKPVQLGNKGGFEKSWLDLLEQDIDENLLHEISLEILEFYDQKTHIISDRDRILSGILGSNIHTVSCSNTPKFTASNPLLEMEHEKIVITEVDVDFPQPPSSVSTTYPSKFQAFTSEPVYPSGSVSPQSVHVPIMEGSESTFSTFAGFASTPLHSNTIESTPSWTPRFERRDRSNSLNEYMVDSKRTRAE